MEEDTARFRCWNRNAQISAFPKIKSWAFCELFKIELELSLKKISGSLKSLVKICDEFPIKNSLRQFEMHFNVLRWIFSELKTT